MSKVDDFKEDLVALCKQYWATVEIKHIAPQAEQAERVAEDYPNKIHLFKITIKTKL